MTRNQVLNDIIAALTQRRQRTTIETVKEEATQDPFRVTLRNEVRVVCGDCGDGMSSNPPYRCQFCHGLAYTKTELIGEYSNERWNGLKRKNSLYQNRRVPAGKVR